MLRIITRLSWSILLLNIEHPTIIINSQYISFNNFLVSIVIIVSEVSAYEEKVPGLKGFPHGSIVDADRNDDSQILRWKNWVI